MKSVWARGCFLAGVLVLGALQAGTAGSSDVGPLAQAAVEYSSDPATLLVSFRSEWPEFADQDPTPLVRVYGDGRVEVYFAAYMKRAGRYELRLSAAELETLLLELTPVLLAFDEAEVETQRRGAEAVLRAEAVERGGPSLFHVTDAETSVFHLNVDSYRPPGSPGLTISKPALDRTWRGLRYDAERYSDLGPVQSLFEVESTLRALAEREELVRIGEPE